jgi:hypothetical protein
MQKILITSILSSTLFLSACDSNDYKKGAGLSNLNVAFVDAKWIEKDIPKGENCKYFKGNGNTPRIQVNNIPNGANAIIVEFSDKTYTPMDNGGHGKIGIWTNGKSSITIPSVAGETKNMPDNMFIEKMHKGLKRGKAGAYLPPCSGGKGNTYYATIKAVSKTNDNTKVLGGESLVLGIY